MSARSGPGLQVSAPDTACTLCVTGIVQGVGFRPFVVRTARALHLAGFVLNEGGSVRIRLEGPKESINAFRTALCEQAPPLARIEAVALEWHPPECLTGFAIHGSIEGARGPAITPDAASCATCLEEMRDPTNRRYGHALITCTDCGPRYSLQREVPFDRPATTMAGFDMCADCRAEYEDPASRRYHAQTISCPACGPQISLLDAGGAVLCRDRAETIDTARRQLLDGQVVAVKGLGGYHLMVDARNAEALALLRERKRRPFRPFALMAREMDVVRSLTEATAQDEALLRSVERPILLLPAKPGLATHSAIAPGLGQLGVMLPLTPLHTLLLDDDLDLVVATSANRSGDSIVYETYAALVDSAPGGRVADLVLDHDRPIDSGIDDTVMIGGGPSEGPDEAPPTVLRLGRGFTPLTLETGATAELPCVLALGGDKKTSLAVNHGGTALVSPHIGDMASADVRRESLHVRQKLLHLAGVRPNRAACDLHPDFATTRQANSLDVAHVVRVQHHHAHLASCLLDNAVDLQSSSPVIGIVLDGTGLGWDGTPWGGEVLFGSYISCARPARLRPLPLPGGDAAARDPVRMAAAAVLDCFGDLAPAAHVPAIAGLSEQQVRTLTALLDPSHADKTTLVPRTSSMGRLFDVVAALTGLSTRNTYEGEAAARLEAACGDPSETIATWASSRYDLPLTGEPITPAHLAPNPAAPPREIDPRPMLRAVLADLAAGAPPMTIARRFHGGLVAALTATCLEMRAVGAGPDVALTGGAFANRVLTGGLTQSLRASGFRPLHHHRLPCGDGGLSPGQLAVALGCAAAGKEQPDYGDA